MDAWPYPLWIAHRGAGALAPENTLAAFRVGAGHGQRAFECDAKLSADEVPFLLHDAGLERTTSRSGTAGALTWAALSRVDAGAWHSPAFAGEPIPTLEAVSRYCLANGFALNIEIKPTPGLERRTGEIVAEVAARLWSGSAIAPLLSSFEPEALAGARDAAAHLPRALLLDTLWPGWFETATSLACVAVVASHGLMDAGLIARLHRAGLRAIAYTVNEPSRAQALIELGIDGIVTDAVDRLSPAGVA